VAHDSIEIYYKYQGSRKNLNPPLSFRRPVRRPQRVPRFFRVDETYVEKPSFVSSPHAMHYFENSDYPNGGLADFGVGGLGMMYVYIQDLKHPVLVTTLNLGTALKLDAERAWVGFTGSTGTHALQVHDTLEWNLDSLRIDKDIFPLPS